MRCCDSTTSTRNPVPAAATRKLRLFLNRHHGLSFSTITRKHSRSYLGDSRMYPTLRADQEPIELCPAFEKLQLPNIHTWDPALGRYTDPEFTIRHQDPGKGGSPYGK